MVRLCGLQRREGTNKNCSNPFTNDIISVLFYNSIYMKNELKRLTLTQLPSLLGVRHSYVDTRM